MEDRLLTIRLDSLTSIQEDNIAAVDTPYFISIKKSAKSMSILMIVFTFLNDSENKKTYKDDYLEIKYGITSGKVYEVYLNQGILINGNEIRKIRKELDTNTTNGRRFDNNIKSCMEMVREVLEKKNLICV